MERYIKIPLETLRLDTIPEFDLHLKRGDNYTLYSEADSPFGERERAKLLESGLSALYVHAMDRTLYSQYVEANLSSLVADTHLSVDKRSHLVYETSKFIMHDILSDPRSGENIKRSGELVTNTISFVLNQPGSLSNLATVTSYDYYTYTHSVNVSLFAIALGQALGLEGNDLHTLGQGALLHDVGKSKIDTGIINKEGPLTEEEFTTMRQHPMFGEEILRESGEVVDEAHVGVMQHHEKLSGSGYPNGLTESEIEEAGRITAIADVFDAISTRRSYKPALSVEKTLKIMGGMQGHFDKRLFVEFVKLMGTIEIPQRSE